MTEGSGRRRPPVPTSVWWLLGALLLLVIVAVAYGIRHFDNDLTDRSTAALRNAGIPAVVHFDGRHGYLAGTLEYEEDILEAVAVVEGVRGVADVTAEMEYRIAGGSPTPETPDTPPPPTSPRVTIQVENGMIGLAGSLGSQSDLDAVVAAAGAAFGADNVRNSLRVDESLDAPAWVQGLPAIIDQLRDLPRGQIAIGTEVSIRGTVDDDAIRDAIDRTVRNAVAPLEVTNRIDVITPTPPSLIATGRSGKVTLQGALPDEETIDRIVAGAAGVYGSVNVVNELDVEPGIVTAEWLDVAPGIFVRTAALDEWRVEISDGAMTVFGRGPADGTVPDAVDAFQSIGGGLVVDTDQLEVAADAVATTLTELLEGSATFRPGSSELSEEARTLLDSAIELLLANPSTRLTVEGHTDSQGSDAGNLELSQARADAVVTYLVAGGVGDDRLTAIGYGETQPIASNDTSEGRAQNRRIEFIVEEGSS